MGKQVLKMVIVGFVLLLALSFASTSALRKSGGVRTISVDDPNVIRLAEATLNKLRRQHQGDKALILVEIETASYQVVSGLKYNLHLKVGESVCAKNKYNKFCRLDEEKPFLACGSKIWEKQWVHFMKIEVHCSNYDD